MLMLIPVMLTARLPKHMDYDAMNQAADSSLKGSVKQYYDELIEKEAAYLAIPRVTLYTKLHFMGEKRTFGLGKFNNRKKPFTYKSIKIAKGFKVKVYCYQEVGGRSYTVTLDSGGYPRKYIGIVKAIEVIEKVDNASLTPIMPTPDHNKDLVTLYVKKNYKGRKYEFAVDRHDLIHIKHKSAKRAGKVRAEAKKDSEIAKKEGYAKADQTERNGVFWITNRLGLKARRVYPGGKSAWKFYANNIRKKTDLLVREIIREGNAKADQIMNRAKNPDTKFRSVIVPQRQILIVYSELGWKGAPTIIKAGSHQDLFIATPSLEVKD